MSYRRRAGPGLFEVLLFARRRVFVQVSAEEYLLLNAMQQSISVIRWCKRDKEPMSIFYVEASAESLGLFDGQAWNVSALATWLQRHCVICFAPLAGRQTRYHSNACKQKAYRSRK